MNIQIVTHNIYTYRDVFSKFKGIIISEFDNIDTFDSFDVNIVDLTGQEIWSYLGKATTISNEKSNLQSLKKMIDSSKKTRFIFVFPQDINFSFDYDTQGIRLRDNIPGVAQILSSIIDISYKLAYEPNKVTIENNKAKADFYFDVFPDSATSVLLSKDSEKVVSFESDQKVYTTIDIFNPNILFLFVDSYTKKDTVEYPEWFEKISFNDDNSLKALLNDKVLEIEKANAVIDETKKILGKNNYYKSILFETGDNLVKIVFDIFKEITGKDLSNFVDVKKEDFNCLIDDVYYVGEIKGVSENVKRKHLSELEDNKQDFIERKGIASAKGLLIINHQRNKAPADREEVYPDQIAYAKKDELLIIESTTLLSIYEAFLKDELDVEKFKKAIKDVTGLLKDEWK